MYFYPLDCYERAIREPGCHQDKETINCYVHLCIEQAGQCSCQTGANRVYARMVNTLVEIICDDLISFTRRKHSYRALKQVKPILYEIWDKTQYRKLSTSLDTLADYFLQGSITTPPPKYKYEPKSSS